MSWSLATRPPAYFRSSLSPLPSQPQWAGVQAPAPITTTSHFTSPWSVFTAVTRPFCIS